MTRRKSSKAFRFLKSNGFVRQSGNRLKLIELKGLTLNAYENDAGFRIIMRNPDAGPDEVGVWKANYEFNRNGHKGAIRMLDDLTKVALERFGYNGLTWPFEPVTVKSRTEPAVFEPVPMGVSVTDDDYTITHMDSQGDTNMYDIKPLDFVSDGPEPDEVEIEPEVVDDDELDWYTEEDEFIVDTEYANEPADEFEKKAYYEAPDPIDNVDAELIAKVQAREYQPLNVAVTDFPLNKDDNVASEIKNVGESTEDVEAQLTSDSRDKTGKYPVSQRFDAFIGTKFIPLAVIGAFILGFIYFYKKGSIKLPAVVSQ